MAGSTKNYGWVKPERNDYLEIDTISGVFEAIDSQLKAVEEAAEKSEGLDEHIRDKNNPHGVTAEQVGALPIARLTAQNVDLNTIIQSGAYILYGNACLNLPQTIQAEHAQWGELIVFSKNGSSVVQLLFPTNTTAFKNFVGRMFWRVCHNADSQWTGWKEIFTTEGGTLSGEVGVNGARGVLFASDGGVVVRHQSLEDSNNHRSLIVRNKTGQSDDRYGLVYNTGGAETVIFGDHNLDLLKTRVNEIIRGGGISMVKSVQRGAITFTPQTNGGTNVATATINAVNVNKSVVQWGGFTNGTGPNANLNLSIHLPRLELTNSTTVTARTHTSSSASGTGEIIVPYQVVEYY